MIINTHQKFYLVFFPNEQFGQVINVSPNSLTMMITVNTEFSYVEVCFTNQASKDLKLNIVSVWH